MAYADTKAVSRKHCEFSSLFCSGGRRNAQLAADVRSGLKLNIFGRLCIDLLSEVWIASAEIRDARSHSPKALIFRVHRISGGVYKMRNLFTRLRI
jgi:hypothetical protein